MNDLKRAVSNFKKAESLFRKARAQLDEAVNPHLKKCRNEQDYVALILLMPLNYSGTRRMYEAIYRLQDSKPN